MVPQQLSDVLGEFARTVVTAFPAETVLHRLVVGAAGAASRPAGGQRGSPVR